MVNIERISQTTGFENPEEFDYRFKKVKADETADIIKTVRLSAKLINMTPEQFFSWLNNEVDKENATREPDDHVTLQRAYELIDTNFGSPEDFRLSDFLPE